MRRSTKRRSWHTVLGDVLLCLKHKIFGRPTRDYHCFTIRMIVARSEVEESIDNPIRPPFRRRP